MLQINIYVILVVSPFWNGLFPNAAVSTGAPVYDLCTHLEPLDASAAISIREGFNTEPYVPTSGALQVKFKPG